MGCGTPVTYRFHFTCVRGKESGPRCLLNCPEDERNNFGKTLSPIPDRNSRMSEMSPSSLGFLLHPLHHCFRMNWTWQTNGVCLFLGLAFVLWVWRAFSEKQPRPLQTRLLFLVQYCHRWTTGVMGARLAGQIALCSWTLNEVFWVLLVTEASFFSFALSQ